MKNLCVKLATLVLTFIIIGGAVPVFAEGNVPAAAEYYDTVLSGLFKNYLHEADTEKILRAVAEKALTEHPELLEDFVDITADNFDAYTEYFTQDEFSDFSQNMNIEYVGIGVTVQRVQGAIAVVDVLAGGPAERAGIQAGDRFLRVGDQTVTDATIDEITALVKGIAGSEVHLVMLRDGEEYACTVVREAVQASPVGYQLINDEIGYLVISVFNENTAPLIDKADAFFRERGIKKLVIDLRDNPGGSLNSVVDSLGYFVPRGKTVTKTEYKNSAKDYYLRSRGKIDKTPYYELAVLINKNSASGAELFAGNIRDHKLGTLIGKTSFGKGTVQEFMWLLSTEEMPMGHIKLTMAEYVLPGGEKINGVGIKPDIFISNRKKALDMSQMEPFVYEGMYQEGDTSAGVLAIKQRFDALGYFVGEINEEYDKELALSVSMFQKRNGLSATGKMDIETQIAFNNVLQTTKVEVDEQLKQAIEVLSVKKSK
ncbi:MAG: S41 family peptidase [Clostridia bacterium]|nr:S41 family peptidase [Clostridia bacterium]